MAIKTKVPNNKKDEQQEFGIPSSFEQANTTDGKKGGTTRVTIKYNVGFGNQVFIRGEGANLSWNKGSPLKNTRADEWVWETTQPFTKCQYKVLINDKHYEAGDNHQAACGATHTYTPRF